MSNIIRITSAIFSTCKTCHDNRTLMKHYLITNIYPVVGGFWASNMLDTETIHPPIVWMMDDWSSISHPLSCHFLAPDTQARELEVPCLESGTMKVRSFEYDHCWRGCPSTFKKLCSRKKPYYWAPYAPFSPLPSYCLNWTPLDFQHLAGPTARMLWSADFHWRNTSPIVWGWNGS